MTWCSRLIRGNRIRRKNLWIGSSLGTEVASQLLIQMLPITNRLSLQCYSGTIMKHRMRITHNQQIKLQSKTEQSKWRTKGTRLTPQVKLVIQLGRRIVTSSKLCKAGSPEQLKCISAPCIVCLLHIMEQPDRENPRALPYLLLLDLSPGKVAAIRGHSNHLLQSWSQDRIPGWFPKMGSWCFSHWRWMNHQFTTSNHQSTTVETFDHHLSAGIPKQGSQLQRAPQSIIHRRNSSTTMLNVVTVMLRQEVVDYISFQSP